MHPQTYVERVAKLWRLTNGGRNYVAVTFRRRTAKPPVFAAGDLEEAAVRPLPTTPARMAYDAERGLVTVEKMGEGIRSLPVEGLIKARRLPTTPGA